MLRGGSKNRSNRRQHVRGAMAILQGWEQVARIDGHSKSSGTTRLIGVGGIRVFTVIRVYFNTSLAPARYATRGKTDVCRPQQQERLVEMLAPTATRRV